MKKIILTLLGLILTTTATFALVDHYNAIPAGVYECPEDGGTCKIHKPKKGDISFNGKCTEKITDKQSKYAPMIKRNQCKVSPDPNKYYVCEFADTKCQVTYTGRNSTVRCPKGKKKLTQKQYEALNAKVFQYARSGKCRNLFPEDKSNAEK